MFKKIMCIISTLIILLSISIVPVLADDTTQGVSSGPDVNEWTVNHWATYLSDIDLTAKDYSFINDIVDYDYNFISIDTSKNQNNNYYLTSYYIKGSQLSYMATEANGYVISDSVFTGNYICFNNNTLGNNLNVVNNKSQYDGYSSLFGMYYHNSLNVVNNSFIWLVSDLSIYNSMVETYPNYSSQIYYCADPTSSFIKYISGVNIDLNKVVAPDGFNKTGIKYSSGFDSPYGKYLIKPYEDEQENLVTAGLFSDLDIYYDSYFNRGSSYDHSETIQFYIDVSDVFVEEYGYTLFDYYSNDWELPNMTDFFEKHFKVVHYEKDYLSPLEFFQLSNSNITSLNNVISIEKVEESYFLKFTMLSEYSVTYNVGVEPGTSNMSNSILTFNGSKVTHTCQRIGAIVGDDNNKGLGSDISQADDSLSRPPTKDELKEHGFDYGYPNTQGSYPYKLTIYRNGVEYFQMYFSKMPSVSSTYYSDKCIDYGVNVSNMKVYMYFKEQHMSKAFDFTNNNQDVYNSDLVKPGGAYDEIIFKPVDEFTGRLLNALLGVNVSEFNNTYTLHFWTNYTGTFENMNGFYCKFNWDLQNSGHFQKNNSDDMYDYTQDYMPEDSFVDNNGNVHGGAVETPTEEPVYNGFNNSEFSFDENNLWDYADSFLNFCARAFKVLPAFIWQLIGCSMVVVIILRIVGR